MSWNISHFVAQLPLEFDSWNSTSRLDYYSDNLYGFANLTASDQDAIAVHFKRQDIVGLWDTASAGQLGFQLERGLNSTIQYLDYLVQTYLRTPPSTTPEPPSACDNIEQREKDFILFMAIPAACILVLVSFAKKRKRMCLGFLGGRPGLQYPINFIDDPRRRWAYMAGFAVVAYRVMEIFQGGNFWKPSIYDDPEFLNTWRWTTVLITILNVIILGVVYYPLLLCVTMRRYLVMNILGLLYVGAWIALLVVIYTTCSPTSREMDHRARAILQVTFDAPVFLAYVALVFAYLLDLVKNLIKLHKKCQVKNQDKYQKEEWNREFFGSRPIVYLQALFEREERIPDAELSFMQRLKRKLTYEKVEAFAYSPRILCTMTVVFFFLYKLHTVMDFFARLFYELGKSAIVDNRELIETQILPNITGVIDFALEFLDVAYWSFFSSIVFSMIFHVVFMIHILLTYKKHMKKLLRGNIGWHYKNTRSPASHMVASMRYSGYQIAYMFYGYIILALMTWIACMLIAYLLVLPLRDDFYSPVIDQLKKLWPSIVFGIAIYLAQLLMAKFCFLQENGAYMALNNRRLFHIVSFYLFFFNVVLGLFACLKRILMSLVFGILLLSRLDRCLLMPGFERFDSGYAAYLGMLELELYHGHPLLKAFIMILQEQVHDTKMGKGAHYNNGLVVEVGSSNTALRNLDKGEKTYDKRIVVKWWKMVTLVHNPSLILDRLQAHLKDKKKTKSFLVDGVIEAAATTGAGFMAATGLGVAHAVSNAVDDSVFDIASF